MSFRNIAIIAHVDHWKTTLVDALLKQSWTFRENEHVDTCVMDSNDQERERWITIYAKNTAIMYKWVKINIVDTPWHADFWSEVERVLRVVDDVVLVVDAYEWPMPQTKFVLKKSLEIGHKPIVVINKIDKPTARPNEVIDMLFDLFIKLWANDSQLDFPIIYTIAKQGIAIKELWDEKKDITPLFDMILEKIEEAPSDTSKPFRMQIFNLWYDNHIWRMWIWRIYDWKVKLWQFVSIINNDWKTRQWKITKIYTSMWLKKVEVNEAIAWDIITIWWISDIYVWETIWENSNIEPLPAIKIDEPTLKMKFLVNDSPFCWKEWKFLTSRNLRDRLEKELEVNVWLKVDFCSDSSFTVYWRWELHLSVLIESMRRELFELQVWAPEVIFHEENWKKFEPIENVIIVVPQESSWVVIEKLWKRKGIMKDMKNENWIVTMEYEVPTRWLLWFKNTFIIDTKWEWIIYSSFSHYWEYKWEIAKREAWSLISMESWITMWYSLWKLQERWPIFVDPWVDVYEWMIIWESLKWIWDLDVNPCKNKQLTNIRASWSDEAIKLTPPLRMTLEDALDYIKEDEYVEITPKSIRLRKKWLKKSDRDRYWK